MPTPDQLSRMRGRTARAFLFGRASALLAIAIAIAIVLGVAGCSATTTLKSLGFDLGGDEPKAFALAVAGGDTRAAYEMLCPSYRFGIPYDSFRAAVEANPFLSTATGVSIDEYRSGGGLALTKEGWIESSSGVAEAQFYLSKVDAAWCLTGVVIGGTPALPVPGTLPPTGAGAGPTGSAKLELPKSLDNDAYRAFGLGNTRTRRYTLSQNGGPPEAGTQRVEPLGVEGTKARFRIIRAGGLAVIGSLEVALETDGLWLEKSSQGNLAGRTLLMPARLEPGATWRSSYTVGTPGGGQTRYDGTDVVLGRSTLTTPAGTFDTIELRSTATVDNGTQHGTVETHAWYAPAIGSIRVQSTTTLDNEPPTTLTVELTSPGT